LGGYPFVSRDAVLTVKARANLLSRLVIMVRIKLIPSSRYRLAANQCPSKTYESGVDTPLPLYIGLYG
ncbi:MAG: hypothetical protein MUO62_05600, partial [Anaerolineales bacterium]|nr:hypothetical protein [Anaerolineales bacterium]